MFFQKLPKVYYNLLRIAPKIYTGIISGIPRIIFFCVEFLGFFFLIFVLFFSDFSREFKKNSENNSTVLLKVSQNNCSKNTPANE